MRKHRCFYFVQDQMSAEPILYANTTARIHVQKVLNVGQFQIQSCSQFCYYSPTPFQSALYFNGVWVSDSRVAYSIHNGTLILNISNATTNDFGVYEVVLMDGRYFILWCYPDYFWEVLYPVLLQ